MTHRHWSARAGALMLALLGLTTAMGSAPAEVQTTTTYGPMVQYGHGHVRTYVIHRGDVPEEVGVALSEGALEGLHDAGHPDGVMVHGSTTFAKVLTLPAGHGTPFQHVLVNWNPGGHEPTGIYDLPHMDFHFYLTSLEDRLAIDPSDPAYQAKAERQPQPEFVPTGYILPEPLAFPQMGVHWVDPASPELNGTVFTHTFIFGTWDGRLIFGEPMVTIDFMKSRKEAQRPLPFAGDYETRGYYPAGYGVFWNAEAQEHRIALNRLSWRD